jgi:hypothetical protein
MSACLSCTVLTAYSFPALWHTLSLPDYAMCRCPSNTCQKYREGESGFLVVIVSWQHIFCMSGHASWSEQSTLRDIHILAFCSPLSCPSLPFYPTSTLPYASGGHPSSSPKISGSPWSLPLPESRCSPGTAESDHSPRDASGSTRSCCPARHRRDESECRGPVQSRTTQETQACLHVPFCQS